MDQELVQSEIKKVLQRILDQMSQETQRGKLEYYHELFTDLKNMLPPILEFGSLKHLNVLLPERLYDIENEVGPLKLSSEFLKAMGVERLQEKVH